MNFEKDLFISYAHIDNQPLSREEAGWVSRFHERLESVLDMRMGKKVRIWRDSKLAGNDIFSDEIISQFPKTAVLLSVLSPRYVGSEWCTREVDEFCKAAQSLGIEVGNKSRIVKVVKTPVDRSLLPAVLNKSLGYEFYQLDEHDAPLELDPTSYGREIAEKFNMKVSYLAWELTLILRAMAETAQPVAGTRGAPETSATAMSETPAKATVYLAECSYDRRDAREALAAELRRHDYEVLPAGPLPQDEAEYVAEVRKLLTRSKLAVHMVGSKYGPVPSGPSEKSVVVLQNELGVEFSREHALKRIIWAPDGLAPEKAEQIEFLARLQSSAEAQLGADLITSPQPEVIKGAVHATLQKMLEPVRTPAAVTSEPGRKLVYLICDQRDRELKSILPLRKLLTAGRFEVKIPVFQGSAAEVSEVNRELLSEANAVVVFYGAGDEAWKASVERDLRKWRAGRGRETAYTYLAQPETADKQDLIDVEEPGLLNCLAGFSEAAVMPLLRDLDAKTASGEGR